MGQVSLGFSVIVTPLILYWTIVSQAQGRITTLKVAAVVTQSQAKDVCPRENVRKSALQQLRTSVNAALTNVTVTDTMSDCLFPLRTTLFGGSSRGTYFDDYNTNITGIIGMLINSGDQVDSIQVTYRLKDGGTYVAPRRGGTGGRDTSFNLSDGEKLTRMEGMTNGQVVDRLTFYSNLGRVYGPYGITGRTPFSVDGVHIVAFFGSYGDYGIMNSIGVYYCNTSGL